MATPDERAFVVFPRGAVRDDIILANWRNELRVSVNPATGAVFTEDEIQRATQPGSRFYIEADSIDLFGQAYQQRALFFAQQIDPRKANSAMLDQYHGRIWLGPDSRLPAVGANGPALATGVPGTVIPGSSTLGDPAAAIAVDPNGLRFQNLATVIIPASGQVTVQMQGIDTGFVTRLSVDTQLTWSANINPGTDPTAAVLAPFDGGFDVETDQEYATRIADRIRNRPASGNATHFQAWSQEATVAVEQAFVYPVAFNAGSVLVAITEKRGELLTANSIPEGPNARVPSAGTLITVANYLVAPDSPVVPQRVFVVVSGVVPQQADTVTRLSLVQGRSGGWADVIPWPAYSSTVPQVQVKTVSGDGLTITVESDIELPNGAPALVAPDVPQMMLFNREVSRFAGGSSELSTPLDVASITDAGGPGVRDFTIVLNSEPLMYDANGVPRVTPVIQVGDRLSPYTDRAVIIAEAMEGYFDSLGPGEVVGPVDQRSVRAARQPRPSDKFPIRAGQALIGDLLDALGGTAADGELTFISRNDPDLPTNITDGPNLVTFGHANIFPL